MSLEAVAAIDAALRSGTARRAEVLARHGITDAAYEEAHTFWHAAIQSEIGRGQGVLVVEYANAFRKAREALDRELPSRAPAASEEQPPTAPLDDLEHYAQLTAELRVAGPEGRRAVLGHHRLDDAALDRLEAEWTTRLDADPSLQGVLATRTAHHERIASMRAAAMAGPQSPLRGTAPPAPHAIVIPTPTAPRAAPERAAATVDMPHFLKPRTMPFRAVAAEALPQRDEADEPLEVPPAKGGTVAMSDHIDVGPVLPFADAGAPPEAGGTVDLGGYIAIDAPSSDGGANVSRPEERSWDRYTVLHLAALHAELDLGREDARVIRARYHLRSVDEQRALEHHFEKRFSRAPSELAEYRDARIRFRRSFG
jgi:hypothetical protein